MKLIHLIILLVFTCSLIAQNDEIFIWPDTIPNSLKNANYQEEYELDDQNVLVRISKVTNPSLLVFDSIEGNNVPSVIICPGGGYKHLAITKEGYKIAKWFNSIGVKAFVLKYRLPSMEISKFPYMAPLQDLEQAIKIVRGNAEKWNIDKQRIGVMGFSAGGHLAATGAGLADFSILIYPVISMDTTITHMGSRINLIGLIPSDEIVKSYSAELNITDDHPVTFMIHAQDDHSVSVKNSLRYYNKLVEKKIDAEIHIYQEGGHGFGMGRDSVYHPWVNALRDWLSKNGMIADEQ